MQKKPLVIRFAASKIKRDFKDKSEYTTKETLVSKEKSNSAMQYTNA